MIKIKKCRICRGNWENGDKIEEAKFTWKALRGNVFENRQYVHKKCEEKIDEFLEKEYKERAVNMFRKAFCKSVIVVERHWK